jgi:hypothetical protein
MGVRGSPSKGWLWSIAAAALLLVASALRAYPASRSIRAVPVAFVAAPCLRTNEAWKVEFTRIVMEVNHYLREAMGVRLRVVDYEYLKPAPGPTAGAPDAAGPLRRSPSDWLPLFAACPPPRAGDEYGILIGLIPEDPEGPACPGVADYPNAVIVLQYLEAKDGMMFVLLHEVCHIFGAIDLMEAGSVMSQRCPSFRLDAFTKRIMRVNRERSFRRGDGPLPEEKVREAISAYLERESLGLGERQISICLEKLRAWSAPRPRDGGRLQTRRRPPARDDPSPP